jgi:hypothetical protein
VGGRSPHRGHEGLRVDAAAVGERDLDLPQDPRDLANGERRQVTDLRTGVAGISPLSPSLTVASRTGRFAYTAREDGKDRIYAIDEAAKREGRPSEKAALDEGLVLLPPRTWSEGQVESLLADQYLLQRQIDASAFALAACPSTGPGASSCRGRSGASASARSCGRSTTHRSTGPSSATRRRS